MNELSDIEEIEELSSEIEEVPFPNGVNTSRVHLYQFEDVRTFVFSDPNDDRDPLSEEVEHGELAKEASDYYEREAEETPKRDDTSIDEDIDTTVQAKRSPSSDGKVQPDKESERSNETPGMRKNSKVRDMDEVAIPLCEMMLRCCEYLKCSTGLIRQHFGARCGAMERENRILVLPVSRLCLADELCRLYANPRVVTIDISDEYA